MSHIRGSLSVLTVALKVRRRVPAVPRDSPGMGAMLIFFFRFGFPCVVHVFFCIFLLHFLVSFQRFLGFCGLFRSLRYALCDIPCRPTNAKKPVEANRSQKQTEARKRSNIHKKTNKFKKKTIKESIQAGILPPKKAEWAKSSWEIPTVVTLICLLLLSCDSLSLRTPTAAWDSLVRTMGNNCMEDWALRTVVIWLGPKLKKIVHPKMMSPAIRSPVLSWRKLLNRFARETVSEC